MSGPIDMPARAPVPVRTDPEQWVQSHADDLFRQALARVGERQAAEDLVQETFLAAWKSQARFAGRSSERTWLLRILRNKIADYYRRRTPALEFADPEALANFEAAQFRATPPGGSHWAAGPAQWHHARQSLERAEFWQTVHDCTGKLPRKVAQVFLLREVEGWTSATICETLNLKQNHLFVLLHRARLALRHCLERNWFGRPPRQAPPE